jgi:hypothetical protein
MGEVAAKYLNFFGGGEWQDNPHHGKIKYGEVPIE